MLEPSPTCAGYCNFLLATAHTKPFEVLCAALLPCFWLYRDVGQRIVTAAAQSNPYQKWIDMYAGEEFGRSVRAMQELCDRLAERATSKQREEMIGAFMLAARFEWMFFNAAYCLEGWPISLVGTLDGPSE